LSDFDGTDVVIVSSLEGLGGHSDDLEKRIKGLEEQMSNMKRLREKVTCVET